MHQAALQTEQRAQTLPGAVVAHQAEAEVARRAANRASSGAGIADEVRDVGAMAPLDDPNATIRPGHDRYAGLIDAATVKAAIGPFPDIAGEVCEAIFIGPKAADRPRFPVGSLVAA